MQSTSQLTSQLQQINKSFLTFSAYDPTTCYVDDQAFDRDTFKQLKKQGLIELSYESNGVKHYSLTKKGKEQMAVA